MKRRFRPIKLSVLITLILLFFVATFSEAWAAPRSFNSVETKAEFLNYLRKNYYEFYQDLVVRFNPVLFFNTAQQAIDHLHYDDKTINGREVIVYDTSTGDFKAGDVNLDGFAADLSQFNSSYLEASTHSVRQTLKLELSKEILIDGMQAGLLQSPSINNIREILQKPPEIQLTELSNILLPLAKIDGFNPRRIGIEKDQFSGAEFINLYKTVLEAKYSVPRLIWLDLIAQQQNSPDATISEVIQLAKNLNPQEFLNIFGQNIFRQTSESLINSLSNDKKINPTKVRRSVKSSYNILKLEVMPNAEQTGRPVMILTRAHPYAAWLRGSVGDCATSNSFAISMTGKEEVYWIRRPDGEVKGYLQLTRVMVNGEEALYVHTISGSEISRSDTRRALTALFDSLPSLGASRMFIPVPEKIGKVINYPEVFLVFNDLARLGSPVPLTYLDGEDRLKVAPFTYGSADLPETNQFGIEVKKESLTDTHLGINIKNINLEGSHLFSPVTQEDALIIALDLRNRESDNAEINDLLKLHGISAESFEVLWNILSNKEKSSVEEFHQRIYAKVRELQIPISPELILHSPLLFRGHFAASDALEGSNAELAIEYLRTYLLSYSDLPIVYSTLTPHFNRLIQLPEFLTLVKTLFRKNLNEQNRILDFYELEHKSAYRTIANLFAAGLPAEPFKVEIDQLNHPWENEESALGRQDGIFVRRITLLGAIQGYSEIYFLKLMDHLESMTAAAKKMDTDDTKAASDYLGHFINSSHVSPEHTDRIYRFLTGSEFGLSFIPELGQFNLGPLNVPGLMEALFKADKPLWAAYLIQKDPWPGHPLASQWLAKLWENKEKVSYALFLEGLNQTPSWLKVSGADTIVDGLMDHSRDNIGNETLMTRILLKHPEKLNGPRAKWLSEVSTPGLAELIINAMDSHWPMEERSLINKNLTAHYPELKEEPTDLPQTGVSEKCLPLLSNLNEVPLK